MEMNVVQSQSGQKNRVCMLCLFFVMQAKLKENQNLRPHICTIPIQNVLNVKFCTFTRLRYSKNLKFTRMEHMFSHNLHHFSFPLVFVPFHQFYFPQNACNFIWISKILGLVQFPFQPLAIMIIYSPCSLLKCECFQVACCYYYCCTVCY